MTAMSDIFDLGDLPDDPVKRAQLHARPELPRRFYETADVAAVDGGFAVRLDGRQTRTPAGHPVVLPARAIAEALAAEWNAQGSHIDPAGMPLSRLVNIALDGVAAAPEKVVDDIVAYAGSDLLCYRPAGPDGHLALIARHWDPVVAWAEARLGARPLLAEGLMPVAQPEAFTDAVRRALPAGPPLLVAALQSLTSLTGSALLALAIYEGRLDIDAAWAAASVDEDWNASLWGADAEAERHRARRAAEARAAALVVAALTRTDPR